MISSALCTPDHEPSAVTLAKRSAVLELGSAFQLVVADPWTRRVTARVEARVPFGATYERHGVIEDAPWAAGLRVATALAARGRSLGQGGFGVYATGPARDAINGASFVEAVRARLGMPVEVVAAEREAALVYRAAMRPSDGGRALLVLLGRTSVEIAFGRGASPEHLESLELGPAPLEDELGGDSGATSGAARRTIEERVKRAVARLPGKGALRAPVVLAGPSAAALARLAGESTRRVTLAPLRALSLAVEGLAAAHVDRVLPGAPPHAAWSVTVVTAFLEALGVSIARVSSATAGEGLVASP